MRIRAVLVLVVALLAVCPAALAAKQYPHTQPLAQMPAPQLAVWQQAAVQHYSGVWRRWWRGHRYPQAARRVHARCAATGVRVPAWVCWYASAARWTARELAQTRAKIEAQQAAAYPAHHQLWLCIHGKEGDWRTGYNPNGHYAGLQMTWSWGYGIVGDPRGYTQVQQEQAAERGWAANRYSMGWLRQQWPTSYGCI